jgi:hypothetical protein
VFAKLELREDVPLPKSFSLALTREATVRRSCETMWQLSVVAGVRFMHTPTQHESTHNSRTKKNKRAVPAFLFLHDAGKARLSPTFSYMHRNGPFALAARRGP